MKRSQRDNTNDQYANRAGLVDTYNLITNGMHNLFARKSVCFRVNYGVDRAWVSVVGHAVKEFTHYLLL